MMLKNQFTGLPFMGSRVGISMVARFFVAFPPATA